MKGNVPIVFVILNYLFINVIGEVEKRSVAFVIDDTGSMGNDIDRVKSQTKQVFDAVLKSDATKFDEFVLVTFNDYVTDLFGSQVRIKTNDADEFRRSLDSINVHGGWDCPENALLGIMNALNSCPSHSVVYVFTDAAAKDYDMFEEVKSLSQKKSIQVTFLLTGICSDAGLDSEKYLVYHKIAEATSGQVFHLKKCNVDQVIEYIIESIKSERNILAQDHASDCPLDVPFIVDGKTSNVMISASKMWEITDAHDCDPYVDDSIMSIKVADSEDNDVESYYVLNLPYTKILHLRDSKPGKYTATLSCHDNLLTYLIVTGATTIAFQHGFSTNEPKSAEETSTLPLPGEKSFISIVLDNPGRDVTLNTLEFIDVDGKVIGNAIDLRLVNADQQFYTTTVSVNIPDEMFKIKVNGETTSKEEITRVGATFIEPQKIFGNIDNKAPIVTIIGDTKVITEPNMPVNLNCRVEAYPKPEIIWENDEREQFRPNIITVDMTGLYNSVLQIEKASKNAIYYCKAKNSINEAEANVEIGIIKREPDNKIPKVTIIGDTEVMVELNDPVTLKCSVEAYPKAEIIWESDEGDQFRPDVITVDITGIYSSILQIEKNCKNAIYYCKAKNSIGKDEDYAKIGIIKREPDKLPKVTMIGDTDVIVESNKPITLVCSVEAYPKPEIIWESVEGEQFQPEIVTVDMTGIYRSILQIEKTSKNTTYYCRADNSIGKDEAYANIGIVKREPDNKLPKVTIIGETKVITEPNMDVTLKCSVEAYPKPEIIWESDEGEQFRPEIVTVDITGIYSSVLQIEKTSKNTTFYCRADNLIGKDEAYVEIGIIKREPDNKLPKVTILGDTEVITEPNKPVTLKCSVEAYPKPEIIWESDKGEQFRPEIITADAMTGFYSSILQIGKSNTNSTYYCRAENSIGKAEAHAQIGIIEEPPLIQGTKKNIIYSVEEDMIEISCTVIKGNPTPNVEWFKNSKKITDGSKYQILKDNTLRFKAQASDNTDFTCVATNRVSSDKIKFQVTVYAKPEIKNTAIDTNINIAENGVVDIPCHATGNPPPEIYWVGLKNSDHRKNPLIFRDHTLRFRATLSDSGTYICKAKNRLGENEKKFQINVYVPVRVHVPGTTTINVLVGEPLHLPCSASGYPEPTAKLTFISKNSKSQDLKIGLPGEKIILEETFTRQERSGDYVCSASNDFSSSNFTYHVEIEAPPYIVDKWSNEYHAVAGDLALRIPCKVRGNPKPIITWSINGLPVANTATQIIDGDGTLILLKPDISFSGSYTCEAANSFSKDAKTVTVEIRPYPDGPGRGDVVSQTLIEEGKSSPITCGISHKPVDLVRWFKDGKEIQIGELQLENPSIRDTGLYTCRVSTAAKSESYHTNVIVGFKPRFISPGPTGPIEYIEGSDAFLDCSAQAQPDPQVQWTHNNQRISVPSLDYKITHMKTKHIGVYKCTVSNCFGAVSRIYRIKSGECQLSLADDFVGFQPLILTETLRWPNLEIQKGLISVPVEKPLLLLCPESSFDYPGLEAMDKVKAVCIQNSIFDVRGREIKFSDLKCKEEIVAYARPNEIHCLPNSKRGHSELYTVGYKHNTRFIGVYDICFDNEDYVPVFARHSFLGSFSNDAPKGEPPFAYGIDQPHDFTQLYDPARQYRTLSSVMGKEFDSNSCHFAKKQLIISRDVIPGLSQTATFNYLNVMPHWSVCYQQNWEEVENRVRALLSSFKYSVYIWTGTSGRMRLPGQNTDTDIYLSDDSDNRQYVPLYLWKVIQSYTDGIVAIIQINIPNLTTSEAKKYVKCSDICHQIGWLHSTEWHDAKKGYTFCCSIDDFENNFNFIGMFKGPRNILGM